MEMRRILKTARRDVETAWWETEWNQSYHGGLVHEGPRQSEENDGSNEWAKAPRQDTQRVSRCLVRWWKRKELNS